MSHRRDLGDALKSVGDSYLASHPADLAEVRAAIGRGRRRRLVLLAASGAAAAAAVVGAFALVVNLGEGSSPDGRVAAPIAFDIEIATDAPYQVEAKGERAFVAVAGNSIARIDLVPDAIAWTTSLGSTPLDVMSGPTGVWVTLPAEDRIARLDPVTGRELDGIDLAPGSAPGRLTVGIRALRVTVDAGVMRIDLNSGEQELLYEGAIVDVAMGEHGFWLLNDRGAIFAVDPDTGEPVAGLSTDLRTPGGEITFARSAIWYGRPGSEVLVMIDEATGLAAPRIDLPGAYLDLDAGAGGPWVLVDIGGDTGEILELDRDEATVAGRTAILPGRPVDMSTSADGIWVTLQAHDLVVHVSP